MDLSVIKKLLSSVTTDYKDITTNILAYWEVLEYFQELTFPRPSHFISTEQEIKVKYIYSEKDLRQFIDAPHENTYYRLYVGGISKYEILSCLYNTIPPEKDNKRFRKLLEKNKAVTPLYTIDLDAEGQYVEYSFQLSSYVWAISRLISGQPVEVEDMEALQGDGDDYFMGDDLELFSQLGEETVFLLDSLRIGKLFPPADYALRKGIEKVCVRTVSPEEVEVSDSFYANDLSRVRKSLQGKERLRLLRDYINAPQRNDGNRQTVCSPDNYRKWLSPGRYPMGRWPSEFSPALMQQMAINIALADKEQGGCGIFSVNGPPGTGKTTLLKDIIAEYVVRRARLLADLKDPDEAFTKDTIFEKTFPEQRYPQKTYGLRSDLGLTDYGILVASCNNTAVENITFELPEMDKLPKEPAMRKAGHSLRFSQEEDLFFGDLASNMLNGDTDPAKQAKRAWGLISARLGKSDNIRSFCKLVLDPFMSNIKGNKDNKAAADEFIRQFPPFSKAQKEFMAQYRLVEALRRKVTCDESVFQAPDSEMQRGNPLVDAEFDQAREDLFYWALVLHGSFVVNSYKWRYNLYSLKYLWEGKYEAEEKERIFSDALNSLFFLVPVVSTTFASVQKMLEYVGREQLGLLIVDEAGQAAPQCAVGALWRSKKAIIVGDPKQVEPVVTTDETLMSLYQKKCGIAPLASYLSKSHSVQGFADQINPYGSWIGDTWVGCPLVVHRRCVNPMFGISNRVSYDGTMILGMKDTVKEEEQRELLFDHSLWIDVPGGKGGSPKGNDHYVEEQGEVCLRLVLAWMRKHDNEDDTRKLYVISPFTTVIGGIKSAVDSALKLGENAGLRKKFKEWTTTNCGTVHKFQGKEAEEVIFLLGCQPSSEGAIAWVNSNILNVAVTRAKKRVYFIGDYGVWSRVNGNFMSEYIYFSDEEMGLRKISYTDLPSFDPMETDDEEDEEDARASGQAFRLIPRYSFLTGPEYYHRHRVIYSHPYQLVFEVLPADPAEILPDLPLNYYRKISESVPLWMCLIYPSDIDCSDEELAEELEDVISWYRAL